MELKITQESKLTEKPLCDIRFRDNTLIAAIIRKNKLSFPDGDSVIEVGDTVVVFTTHTIKKMEDLLK